MPEITIPYNFTPRDYQIPLFRAMDSGYNRACVIWHRRAGKDKSLVNLVVKKMMERVGTYYYFFPTYKQGKKILWTGMDKTGFKFTDHFPKEIVKRIDNTEMLIELKNGSIFQVIGTDNIDSVVGTNPVGCIFSEYSLQNPQAWDFIRPILAENGGWAVFNYTPRGTNHGKLLFDSASKNPQWFVQKLTVDDTQAIPVEVLEQEKVEMRERTGNDALFMQEYYCSFDAPVEGAYYSSQMMQADQDGRITTVPYDGGLLVDTVWDLGVGDSTAIWFVQTVNGEVRLIDYLESSGEGLPYYASELTRLGYKYGKHFAPHDIRVRELGSGSARIDIAKGLGINFQVVPNVSIEDGIEAVRAILTRCWFDKDKTQKGLNALTNYHKAWDENRKDWKNHPEHDWTSHGSDAFRYLAVAYKNLIAPKPKQERREAIYDPITGRLLS